MMKKCIIPLVLTLLVVFGLDCARLSAQQHALAEKLIRFHVVAASDSTRDQSLKLAVRDALLEVLAPLSQNTNSRDEMRTQIERAIPELKSTAQQTLQALGCNDPVRVTLMVEPFPTRYYDTFALPAGDYLSLRVQLGEAQGHNWWCVCFPSLCSSACTQELEAVAAGAGFNEDEIAWMTDSEHYIIRFKLLEWLAALRH